MALLLLTESFLQHCHVLLQSLNLQTQDTLLITRVVGMSLQFLSDFLKRSLQLLVLLAEGGDLGVGLSLLFFGLLLVGGEIELDIR